MRQTYLGEIYQSILNSYSTGIPAAALSLSEGKNEWKFLPFSEALLLGSNWLSSSVGGYEGGGGGTRVGMWGGL